MGPPSAGTFYAASQAVAEKPMQHKAHSQPLPGCCQLPGVCCGGRVFGCSACSAAGGGPPAGCDASSWRVHLMRFVWRFPPVHSNGRSGIGATVSVRSSRNRQRLGASEGIGNHAVRGRVTMTSSIRPYSTACRVCGPRIITSTVHVPGQPCLQRRRGSFPRPRTEDPLSRTPERFLAATQIPGYPLSDCRSPSRSCRSVLEASILPAPFLNALPSP
jgi:hypothetical protein